MDTPPSKRQFRRSPLLVFIGIILIMQACSAMDLKMDMIVSPQNLYVGNSPVVSVHVYDPNYTQFMFSGASIFTKVMYVDNQTEVPSSGGLTNASGWYTFSFTPQVPGRYRIFADTTVNYSTVPGLPAIGNQHALIFQYHNVSSRFVLPFTTIRPIVLSTATPTTPTVTIIQTTPQTIQQTTQVTQPLRTTSAVPAITPAGGQPVTSPSPVQQSPPVTMTVVETLTTTPAPAASPVDIPTYPVPLWLVALIIFVLLVAIGGGLYLKSQLYEEELKK